MTDSNESARKRCDARGPNQPQNEAQSSESPGPDQPPFGICVWCGRILVDDYCGRQTHLQLICCPCTHRRAMLELAERLQRRDISTRLTGGPP